LEPLPYTSVQRMYDVFFPAARRYYWKGLYLDGLGEAVVSGLAAAVARKPSPLSMLVIWAQGGALARVRPADTAVGSRNSPFLLEILANWQEPECTGTNIAWARTVCAIEVTGPGFTSFAVANAVVEVGRATTVHISLTSDPALAAPAPTRLPGIISTRQEFSVSLNQTSFDDLPNNGRRWSTFAILAPATIPDGPFGAVSFRGISSLFNKTTVDGGDNNQAFFGNERGGTRIAYGIGLASIREVHINVANHSAEYGGAAGGVINAITKSGTNMFHGAAFFYDRDNRWRAQSARISERLNR